MHVRIIKQEKAGSCAVTCVCNTSVSVCTCVRISARKINPGDRRKKRKRAPPRARGQGPTLGHAHGHAPQRTHDTSLPPCVPACVPACALMSTCRERRAPTRRRPLPPVPVPLPAVLAAPPPPPPPPPSPSLPLASPCALRCYSGRAAAPCARRPTERRRAGGAWLERRPGWSACCCAARGPRLRHRPASRHPRPASRASPRSPHSPNARGTAADESPRGIRSCSTAPKPA